MAGEEDTSDAAPAEIAVRSAAGKTKRRYLRQFALLSGLYVSEGAGGEEMFRSRYDFALDWDNLYELAGQKADLSAWKNR